MINDTLVNMSKPCINDMDLEEMPSKFVIFYNNIKISLQYNYNHFSSA